MSAVIAKQKKEEAGWIIHPASQIRQRQACAASSADALQDR
jgi:hypothetical protein